MTKHIYLGEYAEQRAAQNRRRARLKEAVSFAAAMAVMAGCGIAAVHGYDKESLLDEHKDITYRQNYLASFSEKEYKNPEYIRHSNALFKAMERHAAGQDKMVCPLCQKDKTR